MVNKFEKEYSHYYKKIPDGVSHVDVYRVLELFDVKNPAIQHAVKKLLVAGDRGFKDSVKDVKEAIVSLERWVEMREEEDSVERKAQKTVFSRPNLSSINDVSESNKSHLV